MKHIKVRKCTDCPYTMSESTSILMCMARYKRLGSVNFNSRKCYVYEPYDIPDWCPLENYEEPQKRKYQRKKQKI